MKYHPLWHLLSHYNVEHILISLIGTCHCIHPCHFARPIQQHHWFCKFWVVWQTPEFIFAGNFVYVGLSLIPRKKQNLTMHKHNLLQLRRLAAVGWMQQNLVVFCVVRFWFFSHMFLHKIPTVLHLTHIGQWGIAPTGTFLVTDASEMLHTSSLRDEVGVQTLTSKTGALNGWFINIFQNPCFPLCQVQFFTGICYKQQLPRPVSCAQTHSNTRKEYNIFGERR